MPYLGCSIRLYRQLFVGGFMPYLGCSVRLYHQLFLGGFMPYFGCSVRLYHQLFVGGPMSYLRQKECYGSLIKFYKDFTYVTNDTNFFFFNGTSTYLMNP